MSLAIENEYTFTKDGVTSDLVSVHSKLPLYISETNSSVTRIVVTISGVDFEAVKIDEDAYYDYYYLDLSEMLKYFTELDGSSFSDKLDIIDTSEFNRTEMMVSVTPTIKSYNSLGEMVETITFSFSPCHLGVQFPSESGFNLWDFKMQRNLTNLKWSNDTYNAIFVHIPSGGNVTVHNRTTGQSVVSTSDNGIFQFKFKKRVQEVWPIGRSMYKDSIGGVNPSQYIHWNTGLLQFDNVTLKATKIKYEDDNSTLHGMAVWTMEDEFESSYSEVNKKRRYELKTNLTQPNEHLIASPIVSFFDPESTPIYHQSAENIRLEVEYNQVNDVTILNEGVNLIEVIANNGTDNYAFASFEIDYTINDCGTPLTWQHPDLGYVSFPFDGVKVNGEDNEKLTSVNELITTMIGINGFKDHSGYKSTPTISLSTNCNKKYLPLLREIYSSRCVLLWTGERGDPDSAGNWVRVMVSGSPVIRENSNNIIFSVELTLPEKQNIKY